jgi:hypothetical protein
MTPRWRFVVRISSACATFLILHSTPSLACDPINDPVGCTTTITVTSVFTGPISHAFQQSLARESDGTRLRTDTFNGALNFTCYRRSALHSTLAPLVGRYEHGPRVGCGS